MKFEVSAVLPIPVLHVPMLRPHSNSIYLYSSSDSVARGSELQIDLASSEFATVVVGKSSFTVGPSRQANVRYFGLLLLHGATSYGDLLTTLAVGHSRISPQVRT